MTCWCGAKRSAAPSGSGDCGRGCRLGVCFSCSARRFLRRSPGASAPRRAHRSGGGRTSLRPGCLVPDLVDRRGARRERRCAGRLRRAPRRGRGGARRHDHGAQRVRPDPGIMAAATRSAAGGGTIRRSTTRCSCSRTTPVRPSRCGAEPDVPLRRRRQRRLGRGGAATIQRYLRACLIDHMHLWRSCPSGLAAASGCSTTSTAARTATNASSSSAHRPSRTPACPQRRGRRPLAPPPVSGHGVQGGGLAAGEADDTEAATGCCEGGERRTETERSRGQGAQ